MKKLLFVAILGTLVACGESTTTPAATDSPAVTSADTMTPAPAPADTATHTDTAAVDTTKH